MPQITPNTAATAKTVTVDVDTTPPSMSFSFDIRERSRTPVSYITNGPFTMTITFTEPVTGFEQSDFEVDQDYTLTDFKAIEPETIDTGTYADTYTVRVIPDPNDHSLSFRFHFPTGVATDAAGNPSNAVNSPRVYVEKHRPSVVISVPDSTVETATFTIRITFDRGGNPSARPLGFEQSDVSLTNNTAGATITKWTDKLAGVFEAEITVTRSGSVTFRVPENVATDLAGNGNTAAIQKTVTITLPGSAPPEPPDVDTTPPSMSFSFDIRERSRTPVSYITNGPFTMTITFTEPVTGFEQSDFEVDQDYTLTDFKAIEPETIDTGTYADTYTVRVIPDPNDHSLSFRFHFPTGVATDAAGNPSNAVNSPRVYVEKHRPSVVISVPDSTVETATFTIRITFDRGGNPSARPLGFEQSDVSLTNNTAGATITKWTDKLAGVFEAEITVTRSGSVTFGVLENVATDLAGNGNTAAIQKTVTITLPGSAPPEPPDVDTTPPSMSFSFDIRERSRTPVSYITNGPFTMTITFTEPVTGFEQSDFEVDQDYTLTDFKAIEPETVDTGTYADTYTVRVIPDPNDHSLSFRFHFPTGVATDAAGNPSNAVNSPRVYVEKHRPSVVISVPDSTVETATFTIRITFDRGGNPSARPLGFEQSDVSLTNNTAGATITKWTDKLAGVFEAEITVTRSGSVTFGVLENVATDLAGNGNTAAIQKTVTITLTDNQGDAPFANGHITDSPSETLLLSNYPNPFNPETWIPYHLADPGDVRITIYDMKGHVVKHLELGHQPAGFYTNRARAAYWNGRNAVGEKVVSGVYFYTLTAGDFTATRKMLIRK